MLEFSKIEQISLLSDEVYRQILKAITTRAINPQQRIVQKDLADQMEVSRTPVRDALLRLETEGVLVRVGRSGFRIRKFSDEEVEHLYRSREAVEGYAIELLTQQCNESTLQRLEAIVAEMETGPKDSVTEYFEANRAIHRAFVSETNNSFLLEMFDSIWNRSSSYILFSELSSSNLNKSLTGHIELCNVLREGNAHIAVSAMREHIREGLQLHQRARTYGDSFMNDSTG